MPIQDWLWRVLKWNANEINLVPSGAQDRVLTVNNANARGLGPLRGNTEYIFWTLENGNVRITFDGVAPAPGGPGHLFNAGDSGIWHVQMALAAQIIAEGVANGVFRYTQMIRRVT